VSTYQWFNLVVRLLVASDHISQEELSILNVNGLILPKRILGESLSESLVGLSALKVQLQHAVSQPEKLSWFNFFLACHFLDNRFEDVLLVETSDGQIRGEMNQLNGS
jgi:hypothetical protein